MAKSACISEGCETVGTSKEARGFPTGERAHAGQSKLLLATRSCGLVTTAIEQAAQTLMGTCGFAILCTSLQGDGGKGLSLLHVVSAGVMWLETGNLFQGPLPLLASQCWMSAGSSVRVEAWDFGFPPHGPLRWL